jgi:hypothetical protein
MRVLNGALQLSVYTRPSLISRIALPAHPEGFQLDPDNRRAFINVPGARQIAVVDLDAGRQTESWRMPDLRANFPMALDAARATVAMVFRDPARLVIVDAKTGKPITCSTISPTFLLYAFLGQRHDDASEFAFPTEHVFVPPGGAAAAGNIENLILDKIGQKHAKGGEAYASGKTLVVFLDSGGGEWFPHKVAEQLPDPIYFDAIWVVGLQDIW